MKDIIPKLKFWGNAVVINAPIGLEKEFIQLGFKISFDKDEKSQNTLVFVISKKEFLDFLNTRMINIVPDSVLWFAYPKGSSKVKTDINRDILRVTAEEYGITAVSAISIDEVWSGLRFMPY